ncbi:MAG: lantibiotic protection ABC transporter ATP-binding protein [Lachnospiraceae bacterium]|nr:lantibiotic protection ABC transporter ATP-binding protein [Lachnospiraceae bacterium]
MSCLLETRELTKRYKKQLANDKIDLRVRKGSIYGLLGPNGAGKSTLMKMLTGMLTPTSGTIYFDGKEMERKDLAYVGALIETAPVYENLTAWENLKVRALLYGLPDSRIGEVLEIVGLSDTGRKTAGKFSLGMKQRLGIAIAILNHPKLLILDEPTNGLDPLAINEFREMVKHFQTEGMTLVISSHVLSEIEHVAEDVGIIYGGKLIYQSHLDKSQKLEELFVEKIRKAEV